jgi:hypothetical protein
MRIESGGSLPASTRIQSPKPEPKPVQTPPGAGDTFVRATPSPLQPPAVATPTPSPAAVFRVVGDALVAAPMAATASAAATPPPRPDVQEAIRDIEAYPPPAQATALAGHLEEHGTDAPEDAEFRMQLLQELGPDRVGQMLADAPPVDGIYSGGWDVRGVLAAAVDVYTPEEQGRLVQQLGSEQLGRAIAVGVYQAGLPNEDPERTAGIRAQLEGMARLVGNVYSLPAGAAGRAELTGALDRLREGAEPLLQQMPGEEVAAWMVSRSGDDSLKLDFAESYLAEFRGDPASLSSTEARAVAVVLGSMEPPSRALAPILDSLDAAQRRTFLSTMMDASYLETPEWRTPYLFNQDVVQGVTAFMMDVARLNPVTFADPEAAQDFRVEAFRAGVQGVDNDLFGGAQGMKDALANMFAADTAGIIHDLSDSGGPNWDVEGRDLAKFFDQVAFRNDGVSRQWVVDALQSYLGVGAADGVADVLAANKGDTEFMAQRGNVMAREMGFLLGALHQGAQRALGEIDGEYERQKAVIDVIGSIAETAIEASPVAAAYKAIKSGSGGKVEVGTVFDWLSETYLGQSVKASKENVTRLSDSVISNVWAEFFDDDSLTGARSEDLVNLYALINAGVALADGSVQPSIRIGG